jgi:hypothetical protein
MSLAFKVFMVISFCGGKLRPAAGLGARYQRPQAAAPSGIG